LTDQGEVIRRLIELNRQGKDALADGDWEGFGRAQAETERLLEQMGREADAADADAAADVTDADAAAGR
jgi:hypothetical protein